MFLKMADKLTSLGKVLIKKLLSLEILELIPRFLAQLWLSKR